jgi:hypothetical protein
MITRTTYNRAAIFIMRIPGGKESTLIITTQTLSGDLT